IHAHSNRAQRPLGTVNVASLAPGLIESELFGHGRGAFTGADRDRKGLFEIAERGTLFLDEIGEIGPDTQARLLRVLQERTITRVGEHTTRPVDVRIIASTHRDLLCEVRAGRFREDLYYRLNVVSLQLPPLRERREDIPLLVNHFLQKFNRENFKAVDEVPRSVLDMLVAYPWPGNVRELENCVHKAVVLAPSTVFVEELVPPTVRTYAESERRASDAEHPEEALRAALHDYAKAIAPGIAGVVAVIERALISHALDRTGGVKLRAATLLGINRVTLDRKLEHYRIGVRRGSGVVAYGTPACSVLRAPSSVDSTTMIEVGGV
ncbi:MAG: sigma-54-dependent Fis family transcriptional regulator, partial [Planctomycetes bacterium]|nr:sigma-54-dependent Fis family transcriptional regulator [Planctomycetota bacterium]